MNMHKVAELLSVMPRDKVFEKKNLDECLFAELSIDDDNDDDNDNKKPSSSSKSTDKHRTNGKSLFMTAIASMNSNDLTKLMDLMKNRDTINPIVIRRFFNHLRITYNLTKQIIVDILTRYNCQLNFILSLKDADITRLMLEQYENTMSLEESRSLIEIALKSKYLANVTQLLKYGPGVEQRRELFAKKMFNLINGPDSTLPFAMMNLQLLMRERIIDLKTLGFLEESLEHGNKQIVKMLLDSGIDDYVRKYLGGENLFIHVFGNNNVDAVKLMRGRRFDVNAKCGGIVALHCATMIQSERYVDALLKTGANPNVNDYNGMTPLFAFGDCKCIELLLHNGADVQHVANNGYTLFDMMIQPLELTFILADIALIDARGKIPIKPYIREKIKDYDYEEFYEKYCQQIESLREFHVCNGAFDLYSALVGEPNLISQYVTSQDVVVRVIKEYRQKLIGRIHSYYLSTLERNLVRALTTSILRCRAVKVLLKLFMKELKKSVLDRMIVERIVSLLELDDLMIFI